MTDDKVFGLLLPEDNYYPVVAYDNRRVSFQSTFATRNVIFSVVNCQSDFNEAWLTDGQILTSVYQVWLMTLTLLLPTIVFHV